MRRRLLVTLFAWLCLPAAAQDQSQPESLSQDCARALAVQPDYAQPADIMAKAKAAIDACKRAAEAKPADPAAQREFAQSLLADGRIADAVAVLLPLAGKNDPDALYALYSIHAFRERGRDRVIVSREAAEAALRKAAELGHPAATYHLALVLARGGVIKRDPAQALEWAEKAVPLASADYAVISKLLLGDLLTRPGQPPAQRQRGLALLEALAAEDPDAKIGLARALRGEGVKHNPPRARTLLDEAWQSGNSGAAGPLAAMLIAGEGGSKDVPRALGILRDDRARYSSEARAALGMLHLEGRYLRREPMTAARLLEYPSTFDIDTRIRLAGLLTIHTGAKLGNPKGFLYDLKVAAEAGEPGAALALMDLLLSRHDQLRDETAGFEVAEKAAATEDRALVRVLERRANWMQTDPSRRALWESQVRAGLDRLMADGFAPAFTLHGKLLRRGGLFPQDDVAATKALQRAAELGDVEGMLLLAKAYDAGLGTPKNAREQVRWLREAAKRDSVEARRALVWEARFDSDRQMTLRDSVTEQVALYNDRLGSISPQDFIGFFMQSRMSDFQPKRIAEALMEGFRVAPAGLAEDRIVPLLRQIPQNLRAEVETILKSEGHYRGDTQGYFGPEARAALAAWIDAGLGREPPAQVERKPAGAVQSAALGKETSDKPKPGDNSAAQSEAVQAYWTRILAAFKGAKNQKDAREAFRMLILLARAGNTHARFQLVKEWDNQALIRELVPANEITLFGIDVLISKLEGMDKAKIDFVFNTSRIERSRQMQRWTDGFMVAIRDDPRLSEEGRLTGFLKDMVFVGGACEAIAGRIRGLKLAPVTDDDGCGPVARDALLDLVKTQGSTGTEIKARTAAGRQIMAETSGEQAAAPQPPARQKRRR